jgi:two-component system response regulator YesN
MVKPVDEEEFGKLLQRARDFIMAKKVENQRMEQLKQSLVEKVEIYFPHVEIHQLVELMKARDARAKEYSDHIVDIVYSNLNNDLIKTESVLKNIVYEIENKMQENYKWLSKFIIAQDLETVSFSIFSDLDSLKAAFVTKIDHITSLLGRLHYGTENNTMIDQVCKCVLENIDGDVSLRAVSDLIFMNKTYVSEAFKQKAGISFTEYLTIVKMERAKKLIADGRLKTYELAAMLGFRDIEYFSKLFKKHIGLSPTEYKQNALNKNK